MLALVVASALLLPGCMPVVIPQVTTPGPGFFRLMLGDFEVTALHDGNGLFDPEELLANAARGQIRQSRQQSFVALPVTFSSTAFLVNTKQHLILIDTGAGSLSGLSFGRLLGNLRASGYEPEQIDYVFLTHLHVGHSGGVQPGSQAGGRTFPNATVRVSQAEVDYWLNPANEAGSSEINRHTFKLAAAALAPYQAASKFQPFHPTDEEILPGFRVVIRAGHSPGHTQYFVESGGQTMVAWGDITHFEWVQLPDPALTIAFDYNQTEARKDREELIGLLLERKYLVAAAHIAFPGMGHLRRAAGPGFEWVPVRYDSEPTRNTTADFGFDNSSTSGPTTFSASTPKSGGNVWRSSFAYIFVATGVYRMFKF